MTTSSVLSHSSLPAGEAAGGGLAGSAEWRRGGFGTTSEMTSEHRESAAGHRFPAPSPETAAGLPEWPPDGAPTQQPDSCQLLRQQLLAGQLQLRWIVAAMEDGLAQLAAPAELARLKAMLCKTKHWIQTADTFLQNDKNDASNLMREKVKLSSRINMARTVVEEIREACVSPSDPAAALARIRTLVHKTLDSMLLRVYPAIFQYSVTEQPAGDERQLYPDLARWQYLLRKGLELLRSSPPRDPKAVRSALRAATGWYSELVTLPEMVRTQLRQQRRAPDGLLRLRAAEPRSGELRFPCWTDMSVSGTVEYVAAAMEAVQSLSAPGGGPVPARPDTITPHVSRSLVDAYWARLGAMVLLTDLMALIPCLPAMRQMQKTFKSDYLNALYDAIIALQIAQCRWLLPRSELQLPGRPPFAQPADGRTFRQYLDCAAGTLHTVHSRLQQVYAELMESRSVYRGNQPHWMVEHDIHHPEDGCLMQPADSAARRRHDQNLANRELLRYRLAQDMLDMQLALDFETAVDNFHGMLTVLMAFQLYKKLPNEVTHRYLFMVCRPTSPSVMQPPHLFRHILTRTLHETSGGGDDILIELYQLGAREELVLHRSLLASEWLRQEVERHWGDSRFPLDAEALLTTQTQTARILGVHGPGISPSRDAIRPPPPPPCPLLELGGDWAAQLAVADRAVGDWQRWVPEPGPAASLLRTAGRPPGPDTADPCLRRLGRDHTPHCPHTGDQRLACIGLSTLRHIRFVEVVVSSLGEGAEVTVHQTLLNVLREGWLPCVLAALRHTTGPDTEGGGRLSPELRQMLEGCYNWLDRTLAKLYRPKQKMAGDKMLPADRVLFGSHKLHLNTTFCRTINWSQACDIHMEMMKTLMKAVGLTRRLVPPIVRRQYEVHLAPLALLETVETGAVLLLRAFVPFRDGRSTRHLLDVSQLEPEVALALDLHAWLAVVCDCQMSGVQPTRETPEAGALRRALSLYERPLRDGSLLEFLALRQLHAEPLRWAVRAQLASGGDRDRVAGRQLLVRHVSGCHFPVALRPIGDLRRRAVRDGQLPPEHVTRLRQLRAVLAAPRPQLLDSVLVQLQYRLEFGQPPQPPPEPAPDSEPVALCDHVYQLGVDLLTMQTNGKLYHYRTRQDHITTDRRHFVKPFGDVSSLTGDVISWASSHVTRVDCSDQAAPGPETAGTQDGTTAADQVPELQRQLQGVHITAAQETVATAAQQQPPPQSQSPQQQQQQLLRPEAEAAVSMRTCSFCDQPEVVVGALLLCSLCVQADSAEWQAYCNELCQADHWEMGHWQEHQGTD